MSVLGGLEHRTVEDAEEGGGESCRGHDKAAKETRRDAPTGRSLYKAPESQNDTPLSQSLFSGEWEEPRQQLLSQGTPPPQMPPA